MSINGRYQQFYSPKMKRLAFPQGNLYDLLQQANQGKEHEYALHYFGKRLTYGWLFSEIERCTSAFLALGIKRGEVVTVCSLLTPETLAVFYALNRLGAISDWLDPRSSESKIIKTLKQTKSKLLIVLSPLAKVFAKALSKSSCRVVILLNPLTQAGLPSKVLGTLKGLFTPTPAFPSKIRLLTYQQLLLLAHKQPAPNIRPRPHQGAAIVHTGGTTGQPKAVLLTNESINAEVTQVANFHLRFKRQERWLSYLPPFVVVGLVNVIHLPLILGMELCLVPNFLTMTLAQQLKTYRPHHIPCISLHWREIISGKKLKNFSLDFVKSIIVGGDVFYRGMEERLIDFLRAHDCRIAPTKCYGSSESSSVAVAGCNHQPYNKLGSVGIPLPGNQVAIYETEKKQLTGRAGVIGEICLAGPVLMKGYYADETASKKSLRTHAGKLWLHTGDLGYLDDDGVLFLAGRSKRMIIRRGFKIYSLMIEQLLNQQKEVKIAAVVGKPDKADDEVPCAHLVLQEDCSHRPAEVEKKLRLLCQQHLSDYQVPVQWYFHQSLPLTANGKIDYRQLIILSK